VRRALLVLLVFCACVGQLVGPGGNGGGSGGTGGSGGAGGAGGGAGSSDGGYLTNDDVYTRLKPTCQGCHTIDQRPFFSSLDAFENLVVYDKMYIVPGNPDGGLFMGLVEGTIGRQMPPLPSDSFAVLSSKGQTLITPLELRQWIMNLPTQGLTVADPPYVHRKTAEQVQAALYAQLGLTETDFYAASFDPLAGDSYALRSPDAVPYADPNGQGGTLYVALGGPFYLQGKWRNDAVTPGFVQALTHLSQAWCRTAVNKSGNTAVLSLATLGDSSATPQGTANIRANIAQLYLKMLGQPATSAEVDDLFTNVFKPYEGESSATAWTAVCAALIRDPLWILY
jgi:hypothetical protein